MRLPIKSKISQYLLTNKETMKKKIGICIGVVVLIAVIAILIAYWRYDAEIEENVMLLEDIVQEVTIEIPESTMAAAETEEEQPLETTATEKEEVSSMPRHDFEALRELNKDIYAWITLPDTQVDYPMLQSETDNKYLDTNIDGTTGYPGCIYTNICNSKDFEDYITVVYGHNMKSGEMFGSLHYFGEKTFFDEYDTFTVETPEKLLTYSVYAAVNYNDKLIPAYYDVKSTGGRDEFIKSLKECKNNSKTYFNEEVKIAGEDKILVLSVCIKGQDDRRYLIVAKRED